MIEQEDLRILCPNLARKFIQRQRIDVLLAAILHRTSHQINANYAYYLTIQKLQKLSLGESDVKSCVDIALDKIGPRLKYSVYLKMAEISAKSGKRTARIIDNPELLVSALRAIFGRGSRNIELKIMHEISQAAGLLHQSSSDLVSFVLQATGQNSKTEAMHVTVISELFPY